VTFALYGYWGGIVAAVRTDMVQGIMIIALSFIAIPAALKLPEIGGLSGMRDTLRAASPEGTNYLSLFDPSSFNLLTVVLLCVNAPLTALALPHLVSVCGAGRSEWEGRMGITGGNMLKRICTIGWSVLALCWLAYLITTRAQIHPDAAFGDAIRHLLSPVLQGVMLACVLAAAMSSGDAFQVTVAGLASQNIYKTFVRPEADDEHLVRVTKWIGLLIVLASLGVAILMRHSVVETIIFYFRVLALAGISVALGLLWRRMNQPGVFCSILGATLVMVLTRYAWTCPGWVTIGSPILTGVLAGVAGSLLTRPPDATRIEAFFTKIHVPIGREERLELPLDQAVPAETHWCTAGGLFLLKPSRESWVGFLVVWAVCLACVAAMLMLLG
jgi:Na+/proline symporter